jgi:hypothetical protein
VRRLAWLCVAGLAACAPLQQAREAEPSGFLRDYTRLGEGGPGEALLVYRNPQADLSRYRAVLLGPVTVWKLPGSQLEDVPEADLVRLGVALGDTVMRRLGEKLELVSEPGPRVLRVRLAITEARPSNVPMDLVTTVLPQARVLSAVRRLATGTHAFVGAATLEGELTDSVSGEVLMAAVDRRVGPKSVRGVSGSWSDVEAAFDLWARRLRDRLEAEGVGR